MPDNVMVELIGSELLKLKGSPWLLDGKYWLMILLSTILTYGRIK